jgi:hypothetical protein
MSTTKTVPLRISQAAAVRVTELGMQREVDMMLEHTCQSFPGLQAIKVTLAPPSDPEDDPRVILEAVMKDRGLNYDSTQKDWGQWLVDTFSPEVCRHFCLLTSYGDADAG